MTIQDLKKRAEYNHKYYLEHRKEIDLRGKEWRRNNPGKGRQYWRTWYYKNRSRNLLLKIKAIKYKGNQCIDCGFNDLTRPEVFDFDHLKSKINGTLSSIIGRNKWKTVVKELDLCELVCANCHRTRTKNRLRR